MCGEKRGSQLCISVSSICSNMNPRRRVVVRLSHASLFAEDMRLALTRRMGYAVSSGGKQWFGRAGMLTLSNTEFQDWNRCCYVLGLD
jgi:hypothetical protein